MAQLLPLSSAAPRFHLAPTPGNGVSRLSVTSARPAARVRSRSLSVRCEQGSNGGGVGLDVWLSRGAMLVFVGAVGVELTTGKGVLQNVGLVASGRGRHRVSHLPVQVVRLISDSMLCRSSSQKKTFLSCLFLLPKGVYQSPLFV